MGLDISGARFLLGERSRGVDFGHTLTLGRQGIYIGRKQYTSLLRMLGVGCSITEYADDFFRGLGVRPLIAMDASKYEGAEIIHDMNNPVNPEYHATFDTVLDGGTLEHVFNFPVAIRNCMEMVRLGGHLILMTPWHNYAGHGFYQFSPELIYNSLSERNGYRVDKMLIVAEGNWYSGKKPSDLRQRTEIDTPDPVLLYVTARRVAAGPLFASWPQQSEYCAAWDGGDRGALCVNSPGTLKDRMVGKMAALQRLQQKWRRYKSRRDLTPSRNPGMVRICRSHEVPF